MMNEFLQETSQGPLLSEFQDELSREVRMVPVLGQRCHVPMIDETDEPFNQVLCPRNFVLFPMKFRIRKIS